MRPPTVIDAKNLQGHARRWRMAASTCTSPSVAFNSKGAVGSRKCAQLRRFPCRPVRACTQLAVQDTQSITRAPRIKPAPHHKKACASASAQLVPRDKMATVIPSFHATSSAPLRERANIAHANINDFNYTQMLAHRRRGQRKIDTQMRHHRKPPRKFPADSPGEPGPSIANAWTRACPSLTPPPPLSPPHPAVCPPRRNAAVSAFLQTDGNCNLAT